MDTITIAVIEGTSRPGRESLNAAKLVADVGRTLQDVKIIFVDPADFPFEKDGDNEELRIPEYSRITAEADAFFIVTPEYNHGYPGSLKRMLDSEYANYTHKPVAVAGVSNGPWGGVRAIEHLIPSLRKMGFVLLQKDVRFPNIQDIFDAEGNLLDEKYRERVRKLYDDLLWMARIFKTARMERS